MITHLRLKAYGKINLALDVLGKRQDGYHEVRMIMQTVGLHDRIDLYRTTEPGIQIETNLFYLPTNEQNLAYRAAKLLMDEFHISQGVSIHLRKFIHEAGSDPGRGHPLLSHERDRAFRGNRGKAVAAASHAPVPGADCQAWHQRIH